jgi:Transposase
MNTVTRIGLDLAKSVFQVQAVNAQEQVVHRRSLRRAQVLKWVAKLPPRLIGMEACGTAHHWARELTGFDHDVRLIPPAYVKAYRRRNKTDAADAAAICEAVGRPSMRFVPIRSVEQQATTVIHNAREMLVKQRTMITNFIALELDFLFGFVDFHTVQTGDEIVMPVCPTVFVIYRGAKTNFFLLCDCGGDAIVLYFVRGIMRQCTGLPLGSASCSTLGRNKLST